MPAGTTILTYLTEGTHAARPVTPLVPTNGIALYYETDTTNTFLYDSVGAAWRSINGGSAFSAGQLHNYLGSNVSLVTGSFTDGPSVAQGSTGTWWVSGSIVLEDLTNSQNQFNLRLWDGTTIISTGVVNIISSYQVGMCSLSGWITAPAGNLRISGQAVNHANGFMAFNLSGDSKDCGISAYRIA